MESKQTAVDMFCSIIADHIEAIFNGSIEQDEFAKRMRQTYEQAKAMEKEQMIEAYKYGNLSDVYFKPEQYYNETYGKGNS
jgi:hypothetical protein